MNVEEKVCNVQCDGCGDMGDLHFVSFDADDVVEYAERDGWVAVGDMHFCPKCVKRIVKRYVNRKGSRSTGKKKGVVEE